RKSLILDSSFGTNERMRKSLILDSSFGTNERMRNFSQYIIYKLYTITKFINSFCYFCQGCGI
ncbi:MAG: hypothetical protein LRZ92_03320, partial [Methanosarcinaceae archaeon]|nr:hypothetical protein [Methanosarcinaceae archaeon]